MTHDVLFSQENHLGVITLNRSKGLNALTLKMIQAIQKQLMSWETDSRIHAVVIKSADKKAFCAGGDVRGLYDMKGNSHSEQMEFFWHEYRLNHYIYHYKKPYIALLDGICMGGGVGISLHGAYPVASENFIFAMPETGIGFFPDIGASHLLSQCPDGYGVYLGLTGSRLNHWDAKALGLVRYVVDSSSFNALFAELSKMDLSDNAHEKVDACIRGYIPETQASAMMSLQANIKQIFQAQSIEAITSLLEKEESDWHDKTLHVLKQKSPLSLKITLAQLNKAKKLTLAECLQMDYCLARHFMGDHDFYEGVRALLVDKDKQPKWQPVSIDDISGLMIEKYFGLSTSTPLTFGECS